MGDAFIVRRGSSGIIPFAAISVTYPSGSTCTCSSGAKTLTAKGTGGSYIFYVPEAGTWVVSCTDGTRTKSMNVVISSQYQVADVDLSYRVLLIENGILAPERSFVFTAETGSIYGEQEASDYYIHTSTNNVALASIALRTQDISSKSKIHLTMLSGNSWAGGDTPCLGLFSVEHPTISNSTGEVTSGMIARNKFLDTSESWQEKTVELDIDYSSPCWVGILLSGYSGGGAGEARIVELYIE